MSYTPTPGTIAYRAIAWLQKQPKDTEVTASVWAESIGNADGESLAMCLRPALHAGMVKRRTKHGMQRPFWFSLGDGTPLPRVAPEDDEDTRDVLPTRTKAPDVKPQAGEVLPGVKGIGYSEVLKAHAQLDAKQAGLIEAQLDAQVVASVAVQPPEPERRGRPMTLRECAQAEESGPEATREETRPAPARAFDAWLSGVSGELFLQAVEVDADGDVILTREQVAAVRVLLVGVTA